MSKIAVMFNGNTYQVGSYTFRVNQPLVVDDATYDYLQKGHYLRFKCWEQESDIVTPDILAAQGVAVPPPPSGDITTEAMASGGLIAKDSTYEKQLQEEVAQREAEIERRLSAQAAAKAKAEAGILPTNSQVFEDASATSVSTEEDTATAVTIVEEDEETKVGTPAVRTSGKRLAVKPKIQRK